MAFGVLLVISGLSRVVAAVVTAALGGGPTFVLTVSTLTAIAVLGLGGLLLRSSAVDAQTGTSSPGAVSYTHLRAHETVLDLVCRLLLEKKKSTATKHNRA